MTVILATLFFGFGGWAAFASGTSAVIASGVINPESVRYVIQHYEGGIIKSILVKEGQDVKVGDPLVQLDDLQLRADQTTLVSKYDQWAAQEARLEAEQTGADHITFPPTLNPADPEAAAARLHEANRFDSRRDSRATDKVILAKRITQAQSEMEGLEKQLDSVKHQEDLIQQESEVVESMYKRGLELLPKRLALLRTMAQEKGSEGNYLAHIAQTRDQVAGLQAQIEQIDVKFMDEVDKDLAEARAKREMAEEDLRKVTDKVERTVIHSPVNGTILSIKFKTEQGIVRPGDPIMEIVPSGQPLIVNAQISPRDINDIHTGLKAELVPSSHAPGMLHRVPGVVSEVSADTIVDASTGKPVYTVQIAIDRSKMDDPAVALQPGMPVEAFITTSERSFFGYIFEPLRLTFQRSLERI